MANAARNAEILRLRASGLTLREICERLGIARLRAKGQLTIPKAVRDAAGIKAGDRLTFEIVSPREILVRKVSFQEMKP